MSENSTPDHLPTESAQNVEPEAAQNITSPSSSQKLKEEKPKKRPWWAFWRKKEKLNHSHLKNPPSHLPRQENDGEDGQESIESVGEPVEMVSLQQKSSQAEFVTEPSHLVDPLISAPSTSLCVDNNLGNTAEYTPALPPSTNEIQSPAIDSVILSQLPQTQPPPLASAPMPIEPDEFYLKPPTPSTAPQGESNIYERPPSVENPLVSPHEPPPMPSEWTEGLQAASPTQDSSNSLSPSLPITESPSDAQTPSNHSQSIEKPKKRRWWAFWRKKENSSQSAKLDAPLEHQTSLTPTVATDTTTESITPEAEEPQLQQSQPLITESTSTPQTPIESKDTDPTHFPIQELGSSEATSTSSPLPLEVESTDSIIPENVSVEPLEVTSTTDISPPSESPSVTPQDSTSEIASFIDVQKDATPGTVPEVSSVESSTQKPKKRRWWAFWRKKENSAKQIPQTPPSATLSEITAADTENSPTTDVLKGLESSENQQSLDTASASIETSAQQTEETNLPSGVDLGSPTIETAGVNQIPDRPASETSLPTIEPIAPTDQIEETLSSTTEQLSQTTLEPNDASLGSRKTIHKIQANQPRARRRSSLFEPGPSLEDPITPAAIGTKSPKSRKLLWAMLSIFLLAIISGGAILTWWMLRETRLKVSIQAPDFDIQPDVIVVLDYSERLKMIREQYHHQRATAQETFDKASASLAASEADLAAREQNRGGLEKAIGADNQQIADILKTSQAEVNAFVDQSYATLDKEFEAAKTELNSKIQDRAKTLGLNFEPNTEVDDPEVIVNAFRLALYTAPKSVNVTQERLWAEDLLKAWTQKQEGWDSQRESIRDQAISMRQPVGTKIEEVRARAASIEKQIEGFDSQIALLREDVKTFQTRKNEAQASLDATFRPFYEELLRLPADFTQFHFQLNSDQQLDIRRLEKNKDFKPGSYKMMVRAMKLGQEYWAVQEFKIAEYRTTRLQFNNSHFVPARQLLE